MAKKRRKLKYEEPVTRIERSARLGGVAGRRLLRRMGRSGRLSYDSETQALVEQAIGFLAERDQLSIDDARDVLIQHAADHGLTMREAAEGVLRQQS